MRLMRQRSTAAVTQGDPMHGTALAPGRGSGAGVPGLDVQSAGGTGEQHGEQH